MKKLLTLFALVAALLLTSSGAWAATYYVDGQSGSDSNDGDSPTTAWKHISYAMSQIEEEDSVMVDYAGGTPYDEKVSIPSDLNGITIQGWDDSGGSNVPTISHTSASFGSVNAAFAVNPDRVTINNFFIDGYLCQTGGDPASPNYPNGGFGIWVNAGTAGHTFENLNIDNCTWGIYVKGSEKVTIKNNTIGGTSGITRVSTAPYGGVGINMIGGGLGDDIELSWIQGNTITNCQQAGINFGVDGDDGIYADRSYIIENTITNIEDPGGTDAWGFKIRNVIGIVRVKDNTISSIERGMFIEGDIDDDDNISADVYITDNDFSTLTGGSTTWAMATASADPDRTYDGYYFWDIWRENGNTWEVSSATQYRNSAAASHKTRDSVVESADITGYFVLRSTINTAYDDASAGTRVKVKGYRPTYDPSTVMNSFYYDEDLSINSASFVEFEGESDDNPERTIWKLSQTGTCGSTADVYGIEVLVDQIELHGFKIEGPDYNEDLSVNMLINGTDANIHHNHFFVTDSDGDASCRSIGIANNFLNYSGITTTVDITGAYIHNNDFYVFDPLTGSYGYEGIHFEHFTGGGEDLTDAAEKSIMNNTFQGNVWRGVLSGSENIMISQNTFDTDLPISTDGNFDGGEATAAIEISDASSTQTDVTVQCNTITGTDDAEGYLRGIVIGSASQTLTDIEVSSNDIDWTYLAVHVASSASMTEVNKNNLGGTYGNDFASFTGTTGDTYMYGALWDEENNAAGMLDAESNWWGSASGPTHTDNVYNPVDQGNVITGDYVDYLPWWTEEGNGACPNETTGAPSFAPVTLRDGSTESWHSNHISIQSAIDAADADNYVIWATAGTYKESVDVYYTGNTNPPSSLTIKGKQGIPDTVKNAWASGSCGAFQDNGDPDTEDSPVLIYEDDNRLLVLRDNNITIEGFTFDMNDATVNYGIYVEGMLDNNTINYSTFNYDDDWDMAIGVTDGYSQDNFLVNYSDFNGPESRHGYWFIAHGRGYGDGLSFTNNCVDNSTIEFRLTDDGDIANVLIDNNTITDPKKAIYLTGHSASLTPGSTSFTGITVTNNDFDLTRQTTASDDQSAFLIDNDVLLEGYFGLNGFAEITFNYNVLNSNEFGSQLDVGYEDGPDNSWTSSMDAAHNWWGSENGPNMDPLSYTANPWWTGLSWDREVNSYNKPLQLTTASNTFLTFLPWWETPTGTDFHPITLTQTGNADAGMYASFQIANDMVADIAAAAVISAESGTYYENFAVYQSDDIEIHGSSDANPDQTIVKTSNIAAGAASHEESYGIFLHNDAMQLDAINLHGLQIEGPDLADFSGTDPYARLVYLNASNVTLSNCYFLVPSVDVGTSATPSLGITNAEDGDLNEWTIVGLHIHDNSFMALDGAGSPLGYWGININADDTETFGFGEVNIADNMFSGEIYRGIHSNLRYNMNLEGNTLASTNLDMTTDLTYAAGESWHGIQIGTEDGTFYNYLLSCNTLTGFAADIYMGDEGTSQSFSDIVIKNNDLSDSYVGLYVEESADGIAFNKNTFENDNFGDGGGVYNADATNELDAENNFWGGTAGPDHDDNTYNVAHQGVAATGDIDFLPFWSDYTSNCPSDALGTPVTGPIRVWETSAHNNLIDVYASIDAAMSDPSTTFDTWVEMNAGSYSEDVQTYFANHPANVNWENLGETWVIGDPTSGATGQMDLENGTQLTIWDDFHIDGNTVFNSGGSSTITLGDSHYYMGGFAVNGNSNNIFNTNGTGTVCSYGKFYNETLHIPIFAGGPDADINAYFPVTMRIENNQFTSGNYPNGATICVRADGKNPATQFAKGDPLNPVINTWWLAKDVPQDLKLNVQFQYPDAASQQFDTWQAVEEFGCKNLAQRKNYAFGARYDATLSPARWVSFFENSAGSGSDFVEVDQINVLEPTAWGVFWGNSSAPLHANPTHPRYIMFLDAGEDYLTFRWRPGDGDRSLVTVEEADCDTYEVDTLICKTVDQGDVPHDGILYTDLAAIGTTGSSGTFGNPGTGMSYTSYPLDGGAEVVWNGTGRMVTVEGLESGTEYYVHVYGQNGGEIDLYPNYNTYLGNMPYDPRLNGRCRMTVPAAYLSFAAPFLTHTDEPEVETLEQDGVISACDEATPYLRVHATGDSGWDIIYQIGIQSYQVGASDFEVGFTNAVDAWEPMIWQSHETVTEDTPFNLVLVRDGGYRLANTYSWYQTQPGGSAPADFEGTAATPTTFPRVEIEKQVTSITIDDPAAVCEGNDITITATVDPTDNSATFVNWMYSTDDGGTWSTIDAAFDPHYTASNPNPATYELTVNSASFSETGNWFKLVLQNSDACGGLEVDSYDEYEEAAEIEIYEESFVSPITLSPSSGSYCQGTNLTLSVATANNTVTWTRGGDITTGDVVGTGMSYVISGVSATMSGVDYYANVQNGPCILATSVTSFYVYPDLMSWDGSAPDGVDDTAAGVAVFSDVESDQFVVSWTDLGNRIREYEIWLWKYNELSDSWQLEETENYTSPPLSIPLPTSATFTDLDPGTLYGVALSATDLCSDETDWTDYEHPNFQIETPQPTIYVSPSSLTFPATTVGQVSSSVDYLLWAENLEGPVNLDIPEHFQVEDPDNPGTWLSDGTAPEISIPAADLASATLTMSVRFAPTSGASGMTSRTVTHSSTNADNEYLAVSGEALSAVPTTQASNINFTSDTGTLLDFEWTNGNGDGVLVVISPDDSFTNPTDGDTYSAGDVIGNDVVVLYSTAGTLPTSTSATVTSATNYWVKVYAFNQAGYWYNTDNATLNPNFPKYLSFNSTPTTSSYNISGGEVDIDVDILSLYRDGTALVPASNVTVSVDKGESGFDGNIESADATQTITTSSHSISPTITWETDDGAYQAYLDASATDYFSAESATFNMYPSTPSVQARSIFVGPQVCEDNVNNKVRATVRYYSGTGSHRILVVREGQVPALPNDGEEYTANTNYGSGDDIDDDGASYVVNKNDATSYTLVANYVSNLSNNVSYAYRVYEYNGTSGVTKYNTSTANYNPTYRTASGCKVDGEAPSGIEVERFAARSSERTVVTEWSTVYEYGNAGFELYRADVEYGDSYELVATYKTNQTLVGQNYSPAGEKYGVIDDDPSLVAGRTYAYRLVSVDLDGNRYDQAEQLVTITAGSNGAGGLEVSAVQPNPVYDHMSFTLALETDQNVTVEILDLTGKTIMVPVDGQVYGPGMHNIEVNFGQIASGTYIMSVTSGTDTHVQRFTIVR